jgi:hypothetical protein
MRLKDTPGPGEASPAPIAGTGVHPVGWTAAYLIRAGLAPASLGVALLPRQPYEPPAPDVEYWGQPRRRPSRRRPLDHLWAIPGPRR